MLEFIATGCTSNPLTPTSKTIAPQSSHNIIAYGYPRRSRSTSARVKKMFRAEPFMSHVT